MRDNQDVVHKLRTAASRMNCRFHRLAETEALLFDAIRILGETKKEIEKAQCNFEDWAEELGEEKKG